ncbi:VanZ family protein [Demequina sp. SYSU T00192]|uniref:VanZ family protein n=1 Tax=Demequina litoralis TaxID=3051660 RepID=A0ABT8G7E7_9MICO|nr:VanZ family protein [Demequina sp. SYSU T00192]MDN4474987.1 VanZ family protein [Demequina sp. SYSU T00192]
MSQLVLGLLAVGLGLVLVAALFVPVVALLYRRRGGVSARDGLLLAAALVYLVAIWVYTLLPLPEATTITCAPTQLDPLAFVDDLEGAASRGHLPTDPAFLQLAFNVLLFVPLGVLVRVGLRRGVAVAGLAGLGLSLLVEVTQVTGVWGLYPCAYRLFDVDDLLTNTLGAVLGSLLALMVPARLRVRGDRVVAASEPRPVTRARRILAGVADLVSVTLTMYAVVVVESLAAAQLDDGARLDTDGPWVAVVPVVVAFALSGGFLAATGRTLGQAAVQLRYVGSPYPTALARALLFAGGIGGYQVLNALPGAASSLLTWLFTAGWLVFALTTEDGRGLPGLASRSRLADAREGLADGRRAASVDEEPAA